MNNNWQKLPVTLVLALLALGPAGVLLAEETKTESERTMAAEITLVGQLSETEEGDFVLVEQESGDEIVVRGPETLADYLGQTVKITGTWAKDDAGVEYFAASTIEAPEASS